VENYIFATKDVEFNQFYSFPQSCATPQVVKLLKEFLFLEYRFHRFLLSHPG
jgi:hypothetical protein